jgi:nephrocystin-3
MNVASRRATTEETGSSGFRIFVSSTFLDMHVERDILVRRIFPAFRRRAQELVFSISEIDLRWGITAAEARAGTQPVA